MNTVILLILVILNFIYPLNGQCDQCDMIDEHSRNNHSIFTWIHAFNTPMVSSNIEVLNYLSSQEQKRQECFCDKFCSAVVFDSNKNTSILRYKNIILIRNFFRQPNIVISALFYCEDRTSGRQRYGKGCVNVCLSKTDCYQLPKDQTTNNEHLNYGINHLKVDIVKSEVKFVNLKKKLGSCQLLMNSVNKRKCPKLALYEIYKSDMVEDNNDVRVQVLNDEDCFTLCFESPDCVAAHYDGNKCLFKSNFSVSENEENKENVIRIAVLICCDQKVITNLYYSTCSLNDGTENAPIKNQTCYYDEFINLAKPYNNNENENLQISNAQIQNSCNSNVTDIEVCVTPESCIVYNFNSLPLGGRKCLQQGKFSLKFDKESSSFNLVCIHDEELDREVKSCPQAKMVTSPIEAVGNIDSPTFFYKSRFARNMTECLKLCMLHPMCTSVLFQNVACNLVYNSLLRVTPTTSAVYNFSKIQCTSSGDRILIVRQCKNGSLSFKNVRENGKVFISQRIFPPIKNVTQEMCQSTCLQTMECLSITYDSSKSECILTNATKSSAFDENVNFIKLTCKNQKSDIVTTKQVCLSGEFSWQTFVNESIDAPAKWFVINVTEDQCKDYCLTRPGCKAIDYHSSRSACWLFDVNLPLVSREKCQTMVLSCREFY